MLKRQPKSFAGFCIQTISSAIFAPIQMSIRICHISTVHSVKDIRIFIKECLSLSENGYEVFYVVTNNKNEIINNVQIVALSETNSRFIRIFFKPFSALIKALNTKSSLYHLHDPELMPIGWLLRLFGKKVIYDAHENLAKDIIDKPWIKPTFLRKSISILAHTAEQFSYLVLNGIIGATENIYEQFGKRKSVLIRNLPVLSLIESAAASKIEKGDKIILVFTGGLTRIRGIEEMLSAMKFLSNDYELWIAGTWDEVDLQKDCANNDGWRKCKYFGQLDQLTAYGLMKIADAGMLTYLPAANHLEAMPNKPFEYMACSLPMVLSDFLYWKNLFGDSAVYVNPKSPQSIADGVMKIFSENGLKEKMAANAKRMIDNSLSWESEEKVLINFYHKILNQ